MVVGIVAVVVGLLLLGLFVFLPTFLKSRKTGHDTHVVNTLAAYFESEIKRGVVSSDEAYQRFKQEIDAYRQPVVVFYDND